MYLVCVILCSRVPCMCNIVFSCVVDNFPFTTNKVQILSQVNESAIDTSKAIPLNYLNFLKSVDGYAGN
jgi:hypothetical protein